MVFSPGPEHPYEEGQKCQWHRYRPINPHAWRYRQRRCFPAVSITPIKHIDAEQCSHECTRQENDTENCDRFHGNAVALPVHRYRGSVFGIALRDDIQYLARVVSRRMIMKLPTGITHESGLALSPFSHLLHLRQ